MPITLSTGATLTFLNDSTLSRPLVVQRGSATTATSAIVKVDGLLTIAAPITGDGTLKINAVHTVLASNISLEGVSFGPLNYLSGIGVITSRTAISFGQETITAGFSPGDLAALVFDTPELDLGAGSTLDFDLAPSGLSDRLLLTGSLVINSSAFTKLSLNFLSPPTGQTYTLLSYASITGTFSTVTGLPVNYSLDYTPTALLLIPNAAAATPEPMTVALLALGTPLLYRRRKL